MPESPGIVHPMKSALRSKVGATAALALALAAALPGRSQDAQSTEPAPREQIPQARVPDGDGFKNVDWEKLNNLYLSDEQLENCKVFSSRDKILLLEEAGFSASRSNNL